MLNVLGLINLQYNTIKKKLNKICIFHTNLQSQNCKSIGEILTAGTKAFTVNITTISLTVKLGCTFTGYSDPRMKEDKGTIQIMPDTLEGTGD